MTHLTLPSSLAASLRSAPPGLADIMQIWWAGVQAVTPARLFQDQVSLQGSELTIADNTYSLRGVRRIVVVGAGKASASMASEFYQQCLSRLSASMEVIGWVNAPASDQVLDAGPIKIHAARPVGINEPTNEAVAGTERILELVHSCTDRDLCIVLLSGGGSAILSAPLPGISLQDKQMVARRVAAAGANIQQLNTVRRAISRVKGGALARACRARQMVTLIISDVLGDPLETIASGPTVLSAAVQPKQALAVLTELGIERDPSLANVVRVLQQRSHDGFQNTQASTVVDNIILANNASAVDAAGTKAVELGYRYIMQASRGLEGDVVPLSVKVADTMEQLCREPQVDCWISGGEPTVKLPEGNLCGRGGRNQQLALLSWMELHKRGFYGPGNQPMPCVFLSAGTDGEDGPTPAAGAWFDSSMEMRLNRLGLDPADYAARADAYSLFEATSQLILSGPTGTNVCDLRIALKPRSP